MGGWVEFYIGGCVDGRIARLDRSLDGWMRFGIDGWVGFYMGGCMYG